MTQITIQGFAYCRVAESHHYGNDDVIDGFKYDFHITSLKGWGSEYIEAGTATLVIETPEGFDPRSGAVNDLQEKRKKLMADFQARMNEIDKQISQFTAIEFTA